MVADMEVDKVTDMVADVKGEKVANILAYLVADREVNKVTDNLVRDLVGRRQCFSQWPCLRSRIRKLGSCSFICFNHIITNQQFDGNTFTYF